VLIFMIVAVLGLSIAAIIATFVAAGVGIDASQGIWPTIVVLPLVGFPIAVLLVIIRLVVGAISRSRGAKDA
jgi:hypothetical protein